MKVCESCDHNVQIECQGGCFHPHRTPPCYRELDYIGYDKGSPNGDYSCEIVYKRKNGITTVLAEKINGRTTANVRFAFYKMLFQISKLTSYIRTKKIITSNPKGMNTFYEETKGGRNG